jgi:glutaredoxin
MNTIRLYSTPGCHLCEMAKDIIFPLLDHYALYLEEIDIAESDELIERYGVRIPVLKFPDRADDLGWPFDAAQIQSFLDKTVIQ